MNPMIKVLTAIHRAPISFQSNYARQHAGVFAELASRGLITCLSTNINTGRWMVTPAGLKMARGE
ncbi:hypothetical protein HOT36_gp36 [Ralstonia phage RPSC1]|uniref:Uncharacterized protein n=1 Tax=Ralstonia phage RPSC1 TaxID=2041351 RepID=A0A2Z2U7Y2_9CAUD|nr:hypothetical protein HOT36_gp36 [Ralstonia phage RPSC1]ATN92966.1 hypothetical protein RPSC1_35 [Ralstonia phage RPSC1]